MTTLRSLIIDSVLIAVLTACSGGASAPSVTPPPKADPTVTADGDVYDAEAVTIPALEPGEYSFRCDLHPAMTGTVVVEG